METRKININLPVDLIKDLDQAAEELYLSRTTFIITSLNQVLTQRKQLKAMDEIPKLQKMILDMEELQKSQNKNNPLSGDSDKK